MGWGAWNLAFAHPEMFAALVPIAGFVDRVTNDRKQNSHYSH
jgi:predicted peptidase